MVQRPQDCDKLVLHIHKGLGHFGVKKTYSLLQSHYWWMDMQTDVQQIVARCQVCDRVRALFNAPPHVLQPLFTMDLGYRWSLDFVGLLPVTKRHNKYVLVIIEHFFK